MAEPIWKDYYVNFGNVESIEYEIRLMDGTTIFSGRSYRRPDEVSLKVKINDICADYIEHVNMNLKEGFVSNEVAMTFRIFNSSETLIDTVTFVNDWSYDYKREDTGVLSDPINRIFDVRMPLLYTVSEAQTIYIDADETHADFNIDFSADFHIGNDRNWSVVVESSGTLTLKNVFNVSGKVKVGDIEYRGITSDHTHALYYINAYGGWDFLLMEGVSSESDKYNRKEYKISCDNVEIKNRGVNNFLNEIEKSFVLNTGWLSDQESAKMHHLLGSTAVYLYDLDNDTMTPVIITTDSCKYKTYQNEGCKLVQYEINVKVAKQMIRR